MSQGLKLTVIFIAFCIFPACSLVHQRLPQNDRDIALADSAQDFVSIRKNRIVNYIRPHVISALDDYLAGDYVNAYEEFQSAFFFLDLIEISSEDEKLLFIINHLEPEVFQGLDIAAAYQEINAAQSALQETAESDTLPVAPIADEIAVEDSVELPLSTTEYKRFISDEIKKLAFKFGEDGDLQLPDDFVKEVELYILSFQTHKREFFEKSIRRSRKYIPLINPIFADKEIPEELAYMAIVESGFSPTAKSRARAIGLWQFVRRTGQLYGLKINQARDERCDPNKATYAASEYLLDLLTIFGSRSFMLAIAAYNAGEGNIQKALRKLSSYKERNFWVLRNSGYLHRETSNYVPQILAAIIIGKNLTKFGFQDLPFLEPNTYETVLVPASMSLNTFYSDVGLSREQILALNPDLEPNATHTPARVINYPLFVPKDKKEDIEKKLTIFRAVKSKTERIVETAVARPQNLTTVSDSVLSINHIVYRVKSGNTLEKISAWFNKSKAELLNWNKFLSERPLKTGDLVYIYGLDSSSKKYIYRIKKGDTLYDLGRRYGVSVADIKDWNGLASNRIHPGQILEIYSIKKTSLGAHSSLNKDNMGDG